MNEASGAFLLKDLQGAAKVPDSFKKNSLIFMLKILPSVIVQDRCNR